VDNWRALDAKSAPSVTTAAVVKADAYGLGVDRVAPALADAGVTDFFVALAEEGAELREILGPDPSIYVFSGLMDGDTHLVESAFLIPLLNSPDQVRQYSEDIPGHPCGLQMDTGMNRLGIEAAEVVKIAPYLQSLNLKLLMSHLACADEALHPMNGVQLAAFQTLTAALSFVPRSLAATGGTLLGPLFHFNMTRPGIGLFGGMPFADARHVVRLDLPVIQVRDVLPGEIVGYGADWQATSPGRVATLAAGYADGLIRAMGNRAQVFAGSKACKVIGRVSMDLITVDVTGLDHTPETMEILGPNQSIDDLAGAAGTIGYEILTSLGGRYERRYKGGEQD
jgi:alanine racemase